jgi:membrane protein required for colicin V production
MIEITWIDCCIVIVIALSVITSLFRGFVKELLSLVVWGLSVWLSYSYAPSFEVNLASYVHDKTARLLVSFIGIFLATLICGGLLSTLINFVLHKSGLSGMDRSLGVVFGFLRGVLMVGLILMAFKMTSSQYQTYVDKSYLATKFTVLVDYLHNFMPIVIKKIEMVDYNHSSLIERIENS